MTAPRRRWFRFSLLTLFAGLTLVGIALGYLRFRAAERQAALLGLRGHGMVRFVGDPFAPKDTPKHTVVTYCLRLFGDQPVAEIVFWGEVRTDKFKEAETTFPEAFVHLRPIPAA